LGVNLFGEANIKEELKWGKKANPQLGEFSQKPPVFSKTPGKPTPCVSWKEL